MSRVSLSQISGIPANSNVVSMANGHTFTQPGTVLQVVSQTSATAYSVGVTAHTAWTDYPNNELRISFTPKFASSKILLMANISMGAGSANNAGFRFTRDGSVVGVGNVTGSRPRSSASVGYLNGSDTNHTMRTISASFLDTAGTTSTIVYNIQGNSESATLLWNRVTSYPDSNLTYAATTISTLTVMEIAQ